MLRTVIESGLDHTTRIRQEIHSFPELMYEEFETSRRIQEELSRLGIRYKAGLARGTGVLGFLPATGSKQQTVALRADIDALPIHEETGLPYQSQNAGKMHACGHDGHTAILLGTAAALAQMPDRPNDVLFLFQPAEEGGAGAKAMCEDGVLDGKVLGDKADVIYGLHNWPSAPAGEILWRVGPMMAATDTFSIRIVGQGGHAAAPHLVRDPIVAASTIVTAFQTVAARTVNPLDSIVVSVTCFHSGSAFNVIPDDAVIKGTMRTLKGDTRDLGRLRIHEIAQGVAASLGCNAEISWSEGYPVTKNNEAATHQVRKTAVEVVGEARVKELEAPVMGGEDFSYYGEHIPASFFFVGGGKPAGSPLVHTCGYDFNDEILGDSIEIMSRLALSGRIG